MKKAISCQVNITSLRAKVDGSLGISFVTPELAATEKVAFMELQGINVNAVFMPLDEPTHQDLEIKTELQTKTQAERIRAVLFIWWKQSKQENSFEDFYRAETERIIDEVKAKLLPEG